MRIAVQWNGKTRIRLVKVLEVRGDVATVEALNGPLSGCSYDVKTNTLKDPPVDAQVSGGA